MSRRRYSRSHREPPEINITAFLNLMVVLIPFLLLTAAFNQLTVLDLYLPDTGTATQEEKQRDNKPELQLVVRPASLILSDRKRKGDYLKLEANDGVFDYPALQKKLLQLKLATPELTQITLLAEPDISYNQIIELMDRIRKTRQQQNGEMVNVELFPDIALGDAPELKGTNSRAGGKK